MVLMYVSVALQLYSTVRLRSGTTRTTVLNPRKRRLPLVPREAHPYRTTCTCTTADVPHGRGNISSWWLAQASQPIDQTWIFWDVLISGQLFSTLFWAVCSPNFAQSGVPCQCPWHSSSMSGIVDRRAANVHRRQATFIVRA